MLEQSSHSCPTLDLSAISSPESDVHADLLMVKDSVVHLGYVSTDSYLIFSKARYHSKETIEQVRAFQPIVV